MAFCAEHMGQVSNLPSCQSDQIEMADWKLAPMVPDEFSGIIAFLASTPSLDSGCKSLRRILFRKMGMIPGVMARRGVGSCWNHFARPLLTQRANNNTLINMNMLFMFHVEHTMNP